MNRRPPRAGMGRKKGSKNKVTKTIKDAVLRVFERLGGDDAMLEWAEGNQTQFYQLCRALIPHEAVVSGELRLPRACIDELHES